MYLYIRNQTGIVVGVAVEVQQAVEIRGFGTKTGETQSERAKYRSLHGVLNLNGNTNHDTRLISDIQIHSVV